MVEPVNALSTDRPSAQGTPSRAMEAYETIRDQIITLRIPPGGLIQAEQLARQLGMGRTPVHEAIKRLEVEQLVNIYPRRGTFVTEVNIHDLSLLTDVRVQLEGQAAYRAAECATKPEKEGLRRLSDEIDNRACDHASLTDLDSRIHRSIYRCAHNHYLEATLTQYYNLILRIWHMFLDRLPDLSEHIAELKPLLQSIAEGDGSRARDIVVGHVSSFERSIHALILDPR